MKKIFLSIGIVLLAQTICYAALSTNSIGYYKLESDGTDSVGTVGTISGTAPTYNSTAGKINNGASFVAASSQYLNSVNYVGSNDWTTCFWYNPQSVTSAQIVISKDDVATKRIYSFYHDAGNSMTLFAWGTAQAFHQTTTSASGMSIGTWYYCLERRSIFI